MRLDMIIAIIIILMSFLLLFLYSACKISDEISRKEEYIDNTKRGDMTIE